MLSSCDSACLAAASIRCICGHLLLAECCLRQARLDRVAFVPAAHQPHKARAPRASGADRLAMLRLAIGGRPEFEASLDRA